MGPAQNILMIRLKSMGDILFTLPAVNRVRAAYPEAKLTFLISQELAPLLEGFRDLDGVIALDRASFRRFNPKAMALGVLKLWRQLRQDKFSLVIDFQGYGETALMSWATGAPQRWGTLYRAGRGWAYTRAIRRDPGPHPSEVHLSMLERCGLPVAPVRNEFILPHGPLELGRRFFADAGLDPARPTLFIQPFTSAAAKDWPLTHYLEVARNWKRRGVQVVFGGGPSERALLEKDLQGTFPLSAGVPLLVTAALMHLSTVVVGGDTGVLHLAVAMGKRVIMLMGRTGPGSCYPFQHKDWAVVPPPQGLPVSSIEPAVLNEACERAFAEAGRGAEVMPRS